MRRWLHQAAYPDLQLKPGELLVCLHFDGKRLWMFGASVLRNYEVSCLNVFIDGTGHSIHALS